MLLPAAVLGIVVLVPLAVLMITVLLLGWQLQVIETGSMAPRIPAGSTVLLTLSGRGDKDAAQVAERLGDAV